MHGRPQVWVATLLREELEHSSALLEEETVIDLHSQLHAAEIPSLTSRSRLHSKIWALTSSLV